MSVFGLRSTSLAIHLAPSACRLIVSFLRWRALDKSCRSIYTLRAIKQRDLLLSFWHGGGCIAINCIDRKAGDTAYTPSPFQLLANESPRSLSELNSFVSGSESGGKKKYQEFLQVLSCGFPLLRSYRGFVWRNGPLSPFGLLELRHPLHTCPNKRPGLTSFKARSPVVPIQSRLQTYAILLLLELRTKRLNCIPFTGYIYTRIDRSWSPLSLPTTTYSVLARDTAF